MPCRLLWESRVRRREFLTLVGAAVAWPIAARAQQPDRMRRIGVLMGFAESDREGQAFVAAFREGLQKLGWAEGRNIRIDYRWTALDKELMQRFAKELVALEPDLILTQSTPATAVLLQQTRTIPIVFGLLADPIGSGFVASFPQPGGNVTGFVTMEPTMAGKWLELLKEIAPRVARVAMLFNPATAPYAEYWLNPFKAAAASFAVQAIVASINDTSDAAYRFGRCIGRDWRDGAKQTGRQDQSEIYLFGDSRRHPGSRRRQACTGKRSERRREAVRRDAREGSWGT
jgi:putative tryptophan/tyrosine transport system substrate-binding protein